MKALIVDDEPKAQINLFNLVKEYTKDVEVVATVGTLNDAVEAIQKFQPDLVFLDVEMDGENGFDLFKMIDHLEFDVIFVTAHDEYAVDAFKVSALDYLLKPIDIGELEEAVEKVKRKNSSVNEEQLDVMFQELSGNRSEVSKLVIPTLDSLVFINVKDILRCEATDNYTECHFREGKPILASKSIKYFEELLPSKLFYRVHRSHLINVDCIKEFVKGDGGYLIMEDASSIPVSRRKRNAFLAQFENHQ